MPLAFILTMDFRFCKGNPYGLCSFKNSPMSTSLLRTICITIIFSACASSRNGTEKNNVQFNETSRQQVGSNAKPMYPDTLLQNRTPRSLLDLPASQDGDIILSEGFYEGDFRSYCLQPGTPAPSDVDAYLQAPLSGYRKDIVESVLRNSLSRPDLDQRNIQLLLWSVVSGSDYNKLNASVKSTARQLLTSKQVFALQGGVVGVMKTIATAFPDNGISPVFTDMRNLFELGNSSYEAYEQIAVLRQPSKVHHAEYNRDQWYLQEGGFYARYFPSSYQRVKIQVYVPEGSLDGEGKKEGNFLLFDPVTMMAVSANSNAQRLGIGAPVADVLRKVIQIQKTPRNNKKPPVTNPNPKGIVLK
jgi:hypothetical protein